jgi:hypothetical protein
MRKSAVARLGWSEVADNPRAQALLRLTVNLTVHTAQIFFFASLYKTFMMR